MIPVFFGTTNIVYLTESTLMVRLLARESDWVRMVVYKGSTRRADSQSLTVSHVHSELLYSNELLHVYVSIPLWELRRLSIKSDQGRSSRFDHELIACPQLALWSWVLNDEYLDATCSSRY